MVLSELAMSHVNLLFSRNLAPSDPSQRPVLIVGQLKNLAKVNYDTIKVKLEPRVSEEVSTSLNQHLSFISAVRQNVHVG